MRIISQSGEFDFPYEQIAVRRDENVVRVCPVAEKKTGVILGAYGTPYQAEKAMGMLREAYRRLAEQKITGTLVEQPIVAFQFPQDSEVEI